MVIRVKQSSLSRAHVLSPPKLWSFRNMHVFDRREGLTSIYFVDVSYKIKLKFPVLNFLKITPNFWSWKCKFVKHPNFRGLGIWALLCRLYFLLYGLEETLLRAQKVHNFQICLKQPGKRFYRSLHKTPEI